MDVFSAPYGIQPSVRTGNIRHGIISGYKEGETFPAG
ncbi:hypothetical protein M2137_001701 [Parabacteroides sp. PFB2-10]|nr:hypothetical protein [Parabacteroides sp. PFB2-10]